MLLKLTRMLWIVVLCVLTTDRFVVADGPADNTIDGVRRVPKLGVEVSEADRQELTEGLQSLQAKIEKL